MVTSGVPPGRSLPASSCHTADADLVGAAADGSADAVPDTSGCTSVGLGSALATTGSAAGVHLPADAGCAAAVFPLAAPRR